MGKLAQAMAELKARGQKAFVPYLTSGDPSIDHTRQLWRALDRAGADLIEVGIPFSDPLADGPTIQRASLRALSAGTTLEGVLRALKDERPHLRARTMVFTYYNPILAMGLARFAEAAADAGADSVLVPDLIPEEAGPLREVLAPRSIDVVALVAPTTPDARLSLVGEHSPALVYAVSLTGVTGARGELPEGLGQFVARCRAHIRAPLIIGFGISTPAQAAQAAALADGVVVGSALVKLVEEYGHEQDLAARLESAARELVTAVKGAGGQQRS